MNDRPRPRPMYPHEQPMTDAEYLARLHREVDECRSRLVARVLSVDAAVCDHGRKPSECDDCRFARDCERDDERGW